MLDSRRPTIVTEAGGFIVPACPPWCVLPADHHLDHPGSYDHDGALTRVHVSQEWPVPTVSHDRGGRRRITVVVDQSEVIGSSELGDVEPPLLSVGDDVSVTAPQARALAAALLEAAQLLEAIAGER